MAIVGGTPPGDVIPRPAQAESILDPRHQPIDLETALRLAGVQNPELLLARQRVLEAAAFRQLAAAQLLPTINLGTNYNSHTGVLQQSTGNILSVQRDSLYVGAGANAVGSGTVNIPGVFLGGNIAQGIFAYLTTKQVVVQRRFATVAVRNQVFLAATLAFTELTRAEGRRAVAMQARDEAREIARLTADYAETRQGRPADANRAASELADREADYQEYEGQVLVASAQLCRVLNLDPSIRLHPSDAWLVPQPIVPNPMPLPELIAVALLNRPELGERRAAVREALLTLEGAKLLPFSPTVLIGFSGGGFGGGSNLVRPVFGGFGGRSDLDAIGYWALRNCGVGNLAMIRVAGAQLQASRYQEIGILNLVRAEVAESYARSYARYARIGTYEIAVRSGKSAYDEDLLRIRARGDRNVLPIELLNSFQLLARARLAYVDTIADYNRSQFELFVALGQPPAATLARPAPTAGVFETPSGVSTPPPPPAPSGLPGLVVPAAPPALPPMTGPARRG